MEANEIKAIVDYELRTNTTVKKNGFLPEGIQRLTDDFLLLQEYIRMFQSDRFRRLCGAWSNFLLTDQEKQELAETPEAERADKIVEKVRPKLRPVWSFFVALCYVLQTGENQLTALDAFWLGLIDEVIGVPDTPSLRVFIERGRQDAEQKAEEQKGGESSAKTDAAAKA